MAIDLAIPVWVYPLLVWTIAWKAVAAWKSARKGHIIWFVALFVFNTAGILPIIYIFFFQNYEFSKKPYRSKTKKKPVKKAKKFPSLS